MIPRSINRTPGTRGARVDTRQRRLESLAAEFALLAQRRSRLVHKSELLDQQRDAAAAALAKLQARMAWLARHMDEMDPQLRADGAPAAPPRRFRAAGPPVPSLATPPATAAGKPASLPAIGRQWLAARPAADGTPDPRRTRR